MKKKKVYVLIKPYSRLHKKDIITSPKTEKGNRVILLPQFIVDMLADYINRLPCHILSRMNAYFPVVNSDFSAI